MSHSSRTVFVWQGWELQLPSRWNPVKLEGDYANGYALFADLHRPRLGLRWQKPVGTKQPSPALATRRALREEVGQLAAAEAQPPQPLQSQWLEALLYLEPQPPGRDVWVACSAVSGRLVELVYHVHRREHLLAQAILPTLLDHPADQPMPWSVFELSCRVPSGMKLDQQRLNAGDLGLSFACGPRRMAAVRQVAVAQLALQRQPVSGWLAQQQRLRQRYYRPVGPAVDATVQVGSRLLQGMSRGMRRRRRYCWMRWIAPQLVTYVLHDEARDRLLLLDSTDEPLLKQVAATVGWAGTEVCGRNLN